MNRDAQKQAQDWLRVHPGARALGPSREALRRLFVSMPRAASGTSGFGTLYAYALELATPMLASQGLVPASHAALYAVTSRLVHRFAREGRIGEYAPLVDKPGFARTLLQSLTALRLNQVKPSQVPGTLGALLDGYIAELAHDKLTDRAHVFHAAQQSKRAPEALLVYFAPAETEAEVGFLTWALKRATEYSVIPEHGQRSVGSLSSSLFTAQVASQEAPKVTILSAPGEAREAIEIARIVLTRASEGKPFEQMAVLLRNPQTYRPHLAEAFRRAEVPAYFSRGAREPNAAGRALLALLRCAQDGLSAARFSEYLSLDQLPESEAIPPETWLVPEGETDREVPELEVAESPDRSKSLRVPRLWEALLVEASVVGGIERWERRLGGLATSLRTRAAGAEDEAVRSAIETSAERVAELTAFALPLLRLLDGLPKEATWGEWTSLLRDIALRGLRRPERVLLVLAELLPLRDVGPVTLQEVLWALEPRLQDMPERARREPHGSVFVGSMDDARGMAFDVVLLPGLAEKSFPAKIFEDPLLPDVLRASLSERLETTADKAQGERERLVSACACAQQELIALYPRIDLETARPRTPSFYALELIRATEGTLIGFDELSRRARETTHVRLGWPAPQDALLAIDACEHDLSVLEKVLYAEKADGLARYLLDENPYLGRALRARARRWSIPKWTSADGLIAPSDLGKEALALHQLRARSFSATALQNYALCPYRFYLQAILRLSPREEPEPIEELDALSKGSMTHEILYRVLIQLRAQNLLPIKPSKLEVAFEVLDQVAPEVEREYHDRLAPAIERIWTDAMAAIRADVREWLRRQTLETTFVPTYFELAFGLTENVDGRDPHSLNDAVLLETGLKLRGSIDLVERATDGSLRATDHKTGRVRVADDNVIKGGEALQPVLYALALERIFPGARVQGGRLAYCTHQGAFTDVDFPLDGIARDAAALVTRAVDEALTQSMFPAAPAPDACRYCDYKAVCGPYEEIRAKKKAKGPLKTLLTLRAHK